jgi:hypothetical protein
MQALRYPLLHGSPSHPSAHRRRDGRGYFACSFRSCAPRDSQQAVESSRRHELHRNDAEAQARDAEIDLLAALPHSSRSRFDRERTPRRGPLEPRPRLGTGDAFSRSLGVDSPIVYEGDGIRFAASNPRALIPLSGGHPRTASGRITRRGESISRCRSRRAVPCSDNTSRGERYQHHFVLSACQSAMTGPS